MRRLCIAALAAMMLNVGLAGPGAATPDYVKLYWEARQRTPAPPPTATTTPAGAPRSNK